MLLLTKLPAVLAIPLVAGLLELICTSRTLDPYGFGPMQKMILIAAFLVTLLIWLFVTGGKTKTENEQEEVCE